MGYLEISEMTQSTSLTGRLCAAAAQEGEQQPEAWVSSHRWQLCAAPGWDAAWASAEAAGNPDPGADPGAITDGMILSEVQAIRTG